LLIQVLILVVPALLIIFSLTKITLLDYSRAKGDDFQQDSLTHFSSAAPWQTLKELKDSRKQSADWLDIPEFPELTFKFTQQLLAAG